MHLKNLTVIGYKSSSSNVALENLFIMSMSPRIALPRNRRAVACRPCAVAPRKQGAVIFTGRRGVPTEIRNVLAKFELSETDPVGFGQLEFAMARQV